MKKHLFPLFVLLLLTAGCKNAVKPPQSFDYQPDLEAMGIEAEQIQALDSVLQSFVDAQKLNCLAAFAAKGGKVIYYKAFGWKDLENRVPASVDDYYVLFSQTKAITTVAFMTLVEQGLVAIDDKVADYFPEISDQVVTKVNEDGSYETRPVETPMTFVHLMSHTSGLNAGQVGAIRRAERAQMRRADAASGAEAGQRSFDADPRSGTLEDEMIKLAKYPLGFDPGSEWNYHISTNMLAYMVERISGKPLRQYVKETILEPLGMDHTDWYYPEEALGRFVLPGSIVEGKLVAGTDMFVRGAVSRQQSYCEGAIGLNGPIEDYAKFCQMMLNKGEFNGRRILKPETVELMTTINRLPENNSGGGGFQFGLGFELYNENKKPVPAVSNTAYAWGGMLGTEYIIDLENDLIVLYYINMFRNERLYPVYLAAVYDLLLP
jgi:CubicO group peptidase (beta-lactamase class C family)